VAALGLGASPLRLGSAWDGITAQSTSPAAAATREKDASTLLLLNEPEETPGWALIHSVLLLAAALYNWLLELNDRAEDDTFEKSCAYTCA